MFCGCKNDPFGAEKPNSHTCPVCLGMPGGLPVPNKKAIEWTIQLGLALNCKINLFSKFDRKHYFYPDLAKGYQISQYDLPFCYEGYIETSEGRIRITRIHLEEDTGKLVHKGNKSLVDFNRSGVPLIEIVTEPDIKTASQAKEYGKKLRSIIRSLGIGDCDMEQGGMRLEANISLKPSVIPDSIRNPREILNQARLPARQVQDDNDDLPDYKVEVKNINSFRFIEQAIEYEVRRQAKLLDDSKTPTQETRGYNPSKGETFSQRSKESAEDYRYLPDPDIPPLQLTKVMIEKLRESLPELPEQRAKRWISQYNIEEKHAVQLSKAHDKTSLFEEILKTADSTTLGAAVVAKQIATGKIKIDNQSTVEGTIKESMTLTQTADVDETEIEQIVKEVFVENTAEAERFRNGEEKLLNFFIGQTMKKLGKRVDMGVVKKLILAQNEKS